MIVVAFEMSLALYDSDKPTAKENCILGLTEDNSTLLWGI